MPALQAESGHWSAFILPHLAAMFADEPWLDMKPSPDAQADLLLRLKSLSPADWRRAQLQLEPAEAASTFAAASSPLPAALPDPAMYERFVAGAREVAASYARDEYGQAMRQVMTLADEANRYIDENKPWVIAKREGADTELQAVCSQGLNLFRVLAAALKPVLPATVARAEAFLRAPVARWEDIASPLTAHAIAPFEALMTRIDPKQIEAMTEASKEDLKPAGAPAAKPVEGTVGGPSGPKPSSEAPSGEDASGLKSLPQEAEKTTGALGRPS